MRSFISSSRGKAALFVAVVALAWAALEFYARRVLVGEDAALRTISLLIDSRQSSAVFGDSQVGLQSFLKGYDFHGTPGQKPEEMERLATYLTSRRKLSHAIVMASPQLFGEFHLTRPDLIGARSLPPAWLPLDLLTASSTFSTRLAESLRQKLVLAAGHVRAFIVPRPAKAMDRPARAIVNQYAAEWGQAVRAAKIFDWSQFPAAKRTVLTTSRVYEQNPRSDFALSASAASYRRVIRRLRDSGTAVCLFRTPVTAEYQDLSRKVPDQRFDDFERFVTELARELDVPLVDYRELGIAFTYDKFSNQDHLTVAGHGQTWTVVAKLCAERRQVSPARE